MRGGGGGFNVRQQKIQIGMYMLCLFVYRESLSAPSMQIS